MVDHDLILSKANLVRKHVKRALEKSDVDIQSFLNDSDRQDIVLFNLQRAVQNCIDIAAHIISDEGYGVPGSNNEMFYMLEENDYLETQMVEKMVKAVGFRNLIVHEYGKLDIEEVYAISKNDIKDLLEYLRQYSRRLKSHHNCLVQGERNRTQGSWRNREPLANQLRIQTCP